MKTYIKILPVRMRNIIEKISELKRIKEIRLRIEQPVMVLVDMSETMLKDERGQGLKCTDKDIKEVMTYISQSSLYAFEEELKKGFITVEGGHRIGITGKMIIEKNYVKNIKHFTSLNIRICHPITGCSNNVLPYLLDHNEFINTLIVSPPKCGKTTLLRDVVRQISNGIGGFKGVNVGLIDERSEVASCYLGKPQNDVGMRTDILDCCPKVEGLFMLIRSMAPDVIVLDEIGGAKEIEPLHHAINSGCKMLCTIHSKDILELQNKVELQSLLEETLFKRYVILETDKIQGHIAHVYDEGFKVLRENIILREVI